MQEDGVAVGLTREQFTIRYFITDVKVEAAKNTSETFFWRARQRAIADFATLAMRGIALDELLKEACRHVADGLNVPMAKLALVQENTSDLLLKAQVGLPEGLAVANKTKIPGGRGSALGYTLEVGAPVISDVSNEARFDPSELVRRSGARISANVVIWANGNPYGSLEADSTEPWQVSESDIDFLQTFADLASTAIERNLLTARVEALAREREILLNEIFHRIKNLIANVLAISRRTAKHTADLHQFQAMFEGRIMALSRAHDLLLQAADQPARLRDLIELEFSAKGLELGKEFTVDGPELVCGPRTLQALALLIFELSTNAVKHGALSHNASTTASIHVSWRVEETADGPFVEFVWHELGVKESTLARDGFGSELLKRLVPEMLRGTARLHAQDGGIEYAIRFPVSADRNLTAVPLVPSAA
jgi:two-component sensor histidine kinase